jgi:hypothetical protein
MDDNSYKGHVHVKADLLGDLRPFRGLPQLGNYILYIPSAPDTHPFVQDYQHNMLLVRREEVSIDGSELNKVGAGFGAFRRQAAAAAVSRAGDGLHNQLYPKHQADLQKLIRDGSAETDYLVHGMRDFKGAMTFDAGMEKALKYKVPEVNYSLVRLTVNAEDAVQIEIENKGVIMEAYVDEFESMSKAGTMHVEIFNNGQGISDYLVNVTNCNMSLVQAIPEQARTIEKFKSGYYAFDIYTRHNLDQNNMCIVAVKSVTGKVFQTLKVFFDTKKYGRRYPWELQDINDQAQPSSP